ncbi:FkbM family methyltransferase [Prosthecomicrobium hirschii]|uniref:FkbM family methyltransferase n=1 Tax=Prosthecodimorpha hirschii TaxID=665126 RepID=UPI00221E6654|nr:FkbM family methyltransferase [Prosthecomicrobium hirschii]MCW1842241.1 FkbM family methyltransferase [Prosthecomicrobium hirschii]
MGNVVGILSASYSGSTVLTMLLGSLPNSIALGETHWLSEKSNGFGCGECGESCSVWTSKLIQKLSIAENWWQTIRESLGEYDWLISSDKGPKTYEKLGRPDRIILLWKDPRSWFRSARKHEGLSINESISSWCDLYEDALEYVENISDVVYIDWDQFTIDPEEGIKELQQLLGYRIISPCPSSYGPAHMIGGNMEARGNGRTSEYTEFFNQTIRRDDRWQWEISKDENETISKHPRIIGVLKELQRRSKIQCLRNAIRRLPKKLAPRIVEQNLRSLNDRLGPGPDYLARPLIGFFEVTPVATTPSFLMFTNNDCVVTRVLTLSGAGGFEPYALALWAALARESTLALDIGAFTGVFALTAAKANPAIRVAAFEPNPLAFARLLTNIKANNEVGRIMPVRAGASDKREHLELRHPFGIYTLASGESFDPERISSPHFQSLSELVTIDAFLGSSDCDHLRPIAITFDSDRVVVKIDVEGFEPRTVRGMRELLARGRTTLIFESLDAQKFAEIDDLLPSFDIRYIDETSRTLLGVDRAAVPVGNFLARPKGADWRFVERATD